MTLKEDIKRRTHIDLWWTSGDAFECRVDDEKLCKNSLPAADSAHVVIRSKSSSELPHVEIKSR